MSYMTLVNKRLPQDIQEIILEKTFRDARLVRGIWMDECHDQITDEVDDRKPFDCERESGYLRGGMGDNLPCSEKVCKCHCCFSEKKYCAFIEDLEAIMLRVWRCGDVTQLHVTDCATINWM